MNATQKRLFDALEWASSFLHDDPNDEQDPEFANMLDEVRCALAAAKEEQAKGGGLTVEGVMELIDTADGMSKTKLRKALEAHAAENGSGNLRTFSEKQVVDILKEVLTYTAEVGVDDWNGGSVNTRIVEEGEVLEAFKTHGITLPAPPDNTDKP